MARLGWFAFEMAFLASYLEKLKCKFIVYKPEQAIQIGEELQEYVDYASVNFKQQKEIAKAFFLYDSY